jgi:predicted house-cleaning noncanonical NTP pyrophosphatase (MazG superfamily)
MKFNKLVRDKIPEIIKSKGGKPVTHIASEQEYVEKLKEKLSEEVKEYIEDSNTEELADILEVIYALISIHSINIDQLEDIRKEKADKRGAFSDRIILDETEE